MGPYDDWWCEFFQGLGAEFVQLAATPERTEREVDRIVDLLDLSEGTRVLDVPCGAGRHSIELARRGYRVAGLDLSEPLVRAAKEAASREGLEAEFLVGDMRELPWRAEFDAAICFWTSFGYFDEAGDRAFLIGVHDALAPGGGFLLETMTVETLLSDFRETDEYELGDLHIHERRRYDHEEGRVETEFTISKGERVERRETSVRVYSYRELTGLLEDAGFEDPRGFDTVSGEPFELGARRLCIVSRRL
jgi:cyclopropane fatty-acyl-phospholipid synthase-like methyltransferase